MSSSTSYAEHCMHVTARSSAVTSSRSTFESANQTGCRNGRKAEVYLDFLQTSGHLINGDHPSSLTSPGALGDQLPHCRCTPLTMV